MRRKETNYFAVHINFGCNTGETMKSVILLVLAFVGNSLCQNDHPCDREIFCYGDLLHSAQMAMLYNDSKTFVDMALKFLPTQVLRNFEDFKIKYPSNYTSKEQMTQFVKDNFEDGTEFENYNLTDWKENPAFLNDIKDVNLKQFGKDLHDIWKVLGRKIKDEVKQNESRYSIYYVDKPVIVPGGRFKEFYYWDSYWIQKGLIISEMHDTVKGMIENFMQMVERLGFIPNGGRVYYQRSQPPLLIPMVKNYFDATNNTEFIAAHIGTMMKEFKFFLDNRMVGVKKGDTTYQMARYSVTKDEPRPESYREDYKLAEWLTATLDGLGADQAFIVNAKRELHYNLKSGAESGFDFSSRWFVPLPNGHQTGDLFNTKTSEIIPVDLNGYLYWNAVLLEEFCTDIIKNTSVCDPKFYKDFHEAQKTAIQEILWDEESGSWFDYDFVRGGLRKAFYPTNLVPLWVKAHHNESVIPQVLKYLNISKATSYPGGIPTSLFATGQQWDFPNGWAPLQHIVVEALENSGNAAAHTLALDLAQRWVQNNHKTFLSEEKMFEKYNVVEVGNQGGGGEYEVVVGFGWSNGVVLDFMKKFGANLVSLPIEPEVTTTTTTGPTPTASTQAGAGSSIVTVASLSSLLTLLIMMYNLYC